MSHYGVLSTEIVGCFLSSFFTFVKVATEHFNHAIVTRHLDKTFLAVRLKKSLFVAAGSKEYLKMYDS